MTASTGGDPHHLALMQRARALGVTVRDFTDAWGIEVADYTFGGRTARVFRGRVPADLSHGAETICDHKHACKMSLRALNMPVPDGIWFRDLTAGNAQARVAELMAQGGTWVAKPDFGTHGDGVRVGIEHPAQVLDHWNTYGDWSSGMVLERQARGTDLRIHIIGGQLVAACVREPAHIIGDGAQSVAILAAARDRAVRALNPRNHLIIDGESRALLADQGLKLDSIPEPARVVVLKRVANMSTGAHAVDLTDRIHPRYRQWVQVISAGIDIRWFSIDVMTEDPTADPETHARILELNARPEWMHHTFSERRTHDIAALWLAALVGTPR